MQQRSCNSVDNNGGAMSVKHLYLVALTAVIGCAGTSDPTPTLALPRTSNRLGAQEIVSAHAEVLTAYDAIQRLRPNWLSVHGVSSFDPRGGEYAMVFVDGQQMGSLSVLRNLPAHQIKDLKYYDVTEAGGTFGIQAGTGGVIEVRTK